MLQNIALRLIEGYQSYMRVFLPISCRFRPTCSEYTRQAICKYGLFKGGFKAIKRLAACHPFSHRAGYDPLI